MMIFFFLFLLVECNIMTAMLRSGKRHADLRSGREMAGITLKVVGD